MLAFVVSGAIYPVVAHSGWDTSGFLHLMGFADFAGTTIAMHDRGCPCCPPLSQVPLEA